jgi:hypothetical protein
MTPVETIPGIGGKRIKETGRGGEFYKQVWYIWHIVRTIVNGTMPSHQHKYKEKRKTNI